MLYDVGKMPGHLGSLFQHKNSKLVQLETYDIDNNLIPTFHLSKALRTGTVIMARCTLHSYITPGLHKDRKVFPSQQSYTHSDTVISFRPIS